MCLRLETDDRQDLGGATESWNLVRADLKPHQTTSPDLHIDDSEECDRSKVLAGSAAGERAYRAEGAWFPTNLPTSRSGSRWLAHTVPDPVRTRSSLTFRRLGMERSIGACPSLSLVLLLRKGKRAFEKMRGSIGIDGRAQVVGWVEGFREVAEEVLELRYRHGLTEIEDD